jgi:hypothetical protein
MKKRNPKFGFYRGSPAFVNGLKDWYKAAGRPDRLLEIGSATGDSAEIFYNCNPQIQLVCVDSWTYVSEDVELKLEDAYTYFVNRFKHMPTIIPIRGFSQHIIPMLREGYFDAVYIDANHNYEHVKKDIQLCLTMIKPGGYIGGHDYASPRFDGCIQAVDEFAESIGKKVEVFGDTSWLIKLGD